MSNDIVAKTITQSVVLPAPADTLYDMYLDPREHEAITGQPVVIDAAAGSEFRAFGGMISGRVLHTMPKRLIVQAWRSGGWEADDLDSTLVLTFVAQGGEGRIDLVHVNVPDHDFDGVNNGWNSFYWTPWRAALEKTLAERKKI